MYEGYLSFGGNEIVNNSRVKAYAASLGITTVRCDCGSLAQALRDAPYTTPAADDAPWYDPTEPASGRFAGVLGTNIVGLSDGVTYQSSVPLAAGGAIIAPRRRRAREVQLRATLYAKDECGLSYGISWLASALRGQVCGSDCGGSTLCVFTCCPPPCTPPPSPEEPDLCGDPYFRTLFEVGVLTGPNITNRRRIPGGIMADVEITWTVGNSYIWRDPQLLVEGPTAGTQLPDYEDPGVPPECEEAVDCIRDPLCPPTALPVVPPPVTDLCYPTGPFNARRWMIPLGAGQTPAWHEFVPYIRVNPGSLALRRLMIRWHTNAMGRDCATNLDPCSACVEVQVPYLPPNAWFTLDGRAERAWVDCPGGPGLNTARPEIYGRGGSPFTWPVFTCDTAMCLEIVALNTSVAPDAKWEISYAVREEAM